MGFWEEGGDGRRTVRSFLRTYNYYIVAIPKIMLFIIGNVVDEFYFTDDLPPGGRS